MHSVSSSVSPCPVYNFLFQLEDDKKNLTNTIKVHFVSPVVLLHVLAKLLRWFYSSQQNC